jgi:integrase
MILQLVKAWPVTALDSPEKYHLPVSIALDGKGRQLVISRFEDVVWDFWPYLSQENLAQNSKRINWALMLPDGSRLTDPQHTDLLENTKAFIWSLWADPIDGRKRPTMRTLIAKFKSTIHLLRWMISQGMTRFTHLNGRTLDYVPVAKISAKKSLVSETTLQHRLQILDDLYLQREKLKDVLSVHPWPEQTSKQLAGSSLADNYMTGTERIPDRVAKDLAKAALEYVENKAKHLLTARDAVKATADAGQLRGLSASHISTYYISPVAREYGFNGARALNDELRHLRNACYIAINQFSGIRNSEMMSLATHCISHGKSYDGSTDLTWLYGTIYKTGQRTHKWLVPAVVEKAVHIMERYSEPFRAKLLAEESTLVKDLEGPDERNKKALVRRLETIRRQKNRLFLGERPRDHRQIQVLSNAAINYQLKQFCRALNILGDDGEPWPLASHQFRRTYAYFVASSELGDLHYLREHFGHWSIDMTLLYAQGATDEFEIDNGLLDEIMAVKREKQETILHAYVDNDVPLANGEHWLGDWRRTVRTAANKDELIRELSGTITLNGTGHSWCVGSAKGTGCDGICVFEADMCVDCNYGIIGPEHLPVWKEIARQQTEALAMPDMGTPAKVRTQRILEKAQKVIAKLESNR